MNDTQERQYLEDVPRDVQDLIFEDRCLEAAQLLMEQKGLGKVQAAMEAGRIASRMSEQFPDAVAEPSLRPALTAKQQSNATWAFISLFLVVGAVFSTIGIHGLALGFASRSWPSTEARILQSEVERNTSGIGWIDIHLLSSALLNHIPIWTRDKKLNAAAKALGISEKE